MAPAAGMLGYPPLHARLHPVAPVHVIVRTNLHQEYDHSTVLIDVDENVLFCLIMYSLKAVPLEIHKIYTSSESLPGTLHTSRL